MDQDNLIGQVTAWKHEFIEEVISYYQNGERERGRLAFQRWKERFLEFLEENTPNEADRFRIATRHFVLVSKSGESDYDAFMREDGKTCLAFLDDLVNAIAKGQIKFGKTTKKVPNKSQPPLVNRTNSAPTQSNNRQLGASIIGGFLVFLVVMGAIADITGAWTGIRDFISGMIKSEQAPTSVPLNSQNNTQKTTEISDPTESIDINSSQTPERSLEEPTNIVMTTPTITLTSSMQYCGNLTVTAKEVLIRERPSISAHVLGSAQQNMDANLICNSEQVITRVIWVQIIVTTNDHQEIVGWVPGQDVTYPPTCIDTHVMTAELLVRDKPSTESTVIVALEKGYSVSIICDSEVRPGDINWVRIRAVLSDGTIIIGWVPSMDVT